MLLKVVMFNSISSSASSLLRFYLNEVKFFSPHLKLLFTLHIDLFHLRFHVYFLSFFPLTAFYKLRLQFRVYMKCSLLFSFTCIQLQFPFPIFFYCLLEFRPNFFLCVSSSIAFYLLTFFEFPDLRLFSQKHPDFRHPYGAEFS